MSDPIRGAALWMTGAIVSFSAMAVAGREVSFALDTFELMTYRSLVGLAIVVTVSALSGTIRQIPTRRIGLHGLRNVAHFTGQNLWFYAITMIPLAQVFAIEFTSPIWVALAAPFLLGERLTRTRLVVAALGFVGVLLVARPTLDGVSSGQAAAAGAAICFAGTAILTKVLTRTETITCILFWLTILQALMGLVCAGIDGDITLPTSETLPWLVLIGCAGLAAHFCLTTALGIAPATIVIPFDFLRLPVIAAVGMALYGEPLDPYVVLGAAIICGANYMNVIAEQRRRRTASVAH
ncbi:drug/metabolite transporter (DMT)-like permease [Palleronia aestuarii]|uniref:Drug/metabolite transporter (DMT)-like permease n=1 Tax=Palleronia aestuarii TaxID=568105 RepID=A0A2W7Q9S4_9RHOB|nr:DMT family transporter [Palleronia aestuarii]PZX18479.1 drug/metabolite transporter (DMT)-like permease [Palleronia aestuarii]